MKKNPLMKAILFLFSPVGRLNPKEYLLKVAVLQATRIGLSYLLLLKFLPEELVLVLNFFIGVCTLVAVLRRLHDWGGGGILVLVQIMANAVGAAFTVSNSPASAYVTLLPYIVLAVWAIPKSIPEPEPSPIIQTIKKSSKGGRAKR